MSKRFVLREELRKIIETMEEEVKIMIDKKQNGSYTDGEISQLCEEASKVSEIFEEMFVSNKMHDEARNANFLRQCEKLRQKL
jgi:hypothetical protein